MERRQFLIGAAAATASGQLSLGQPLDQTSPEAANVSSTERTYQILGVPLRTGSLMPGSENDGQAYRDAHLLSRLRAVGCKTMDDGDVAIPSYLPHHSIPPIRSWPGPRIAWDCISERLGPHLQKRRVPILIGCDCSVVVATTQALRTASTENIHVLYVDGDFDDAAPEAKQCHSAAACAVWLLTNDSPFCAGPPLAPSQVTVIGWSNPSQSTRARIEELKP